eukprot:scaffold635364_cov15-Prasinocladus_malaysianus.AAC.1
MKQCGQTLLYWHERNGEIQREALLIKSLEWKRSLLRRGVCAVSHTCSPAAGSLPRQLIELAPNLRNAVAAAMQPTGQGFG